MWKMHLQSVTSANRLNIYKIIVDVQPTGTQGVEICLICIAKNDLGTNTGTE